MLTPLNPKIIVYRNVTRWVVWCYSQTSDNCPNHYHSSNDIQMLFFHLFNQQQFKSTQPFHVTTPPFLRPASQLWQINSKSFHLIYFCENKKAHTLHLNIQPIFVLGLNFIHFSIFIFWLHRVAKSSQLNIISSVLAKLEWE